MTTRPKPKAALFIDVANCQNLDFAVMLRTARRYGNLTLAQAFGNFAHRETVGQAAEQLYVLGVQLIHCPAWRNGSGELKSTADEMLMSQVLNVITRTPSLARVLIASGDGHYVPMVLESKRRGCEVIVLAAAGAVSRLLEQTADRLITLAPVASGGAKAAPARTPARASAH